MQEQKPCSYVHVGKLLVIDVEVQLSLTQNYLEWGAVNESIEENSTSKILLEDILNVVVNDDDTTVFALYHIVKKPTYVYEVGETYFTCPDGKTCQTWVEQIQTCIKLLDIKKPKNLLVFINPYGGGRKGVLTYQTHVAPVFDLAGITTDIIVTERADHARDLLQEYDFTGIDGVVCVGGDGTFAECFSGLLLRAMKDEERVTDDPDAELVPSPVRLGAIAGGTGNQIALSMYGTRDITTAALHIALGSKTDRWLGASATFSDDQLLAYNFLLLSFGQHADLFYDAEQYRSLGMFRMFWFWMKHTMTPNAIDVEIEYLPKQEVTEATLPESEEIKTKLDAKLEDKCKKRWEKMHGKFIGLDMFPYFLGHVKHPASIDEYDEVWHMYGIKECGRWDLLKYYKSLLSKTLEENPVVEHFEFEACKIKIKGGGKPREDKYPLALDGDPRLLEHASVDIRIHKHVICCLGRPWKVIC